MNESEGESKELKDLRHLYKYSYVYICRNIQVYKI